LNHPGTIISDVSPYGDSSSPSSLEMYHHMVTWKACNFQASCARRFCHTEVLVRTVQSWHHEHWYIWTHKCWSIHSSTCFPSQLLYHLWMELYGSQLRYKLWSVKNIIFWGVMLFSPWKFTSISEEHIASIFRVKE
jgi:hypothetical protein